MDNKKTGIFSSYFKKIKRLLIVISSLIIIGLISYTLILYGGMLVVNEESFVLDATTTIETTEGKVIHRLFHENRVSVTLNDVPDHVKSAFISIEDSRFYSHHGVDFKSVIRAVYRDIIALDKVEGASTITQQLAKNLFLENDKTWMRKTKEVMAALYMERNFSKDEILELYLNKIYFGNGVYGIEAASQRFFSKTISDVTIAEGALLAGIIKAPNGYSPINHPEKALNRRDLVLKSMNNTGVISTEQLLQEQGKTLGLTIHTTEANPWADSYLDLIMKEAVEKHKLSVNELKRGGYRIVVHVNESIQKIVYEEFKNADYFPGNTDGVEGAFVMIDQKNGTIVSAMGGRDYKLGDLNRVTVKRQPGSTMKPLAVYGPALMKDEYEAYSLIHDEQIEYDGDIISNFDGQYDGSVSIYDALVKSKNAPAVWLLDQIGIDYSKEYLEKMNMVLPDEGLAIALGGLSKGLTPLQMVAGYRSFANNGKTIVPLTIDKIYDQQGELITKTSARETEVFNPQVAWNMTEMLISAVEIGTGDAGEYSKKIAGKTGSTQHPHAKGNYKDAWFVGYTPEYVSALWMGYDISDKDHYLTAGSSYPTKLTKKILSEMDKQQSLTATFTKPEGVISIPEPLALPTITDIDVSYIFGGFSLVKGKITWVGPEDERIVYHIYKEQDEVDEHIGEVSGENEFVIDKVSLFQSANYYVVPYDRLTGVTGERSKVVKLSLN